MNTFNPCTATEASRLIRCTEASFKLDCTMFWNGDGTLTLYSHKANEEGKSVKSRYELDLNKPTCTCPDFAKPGHGTFCKHLIFAERVARDVEIEEAQESLLAQMTEDAENAEMAYPY